MTDKEIKDWARLANSTDVNKALASELLMPYEEDHIMLERCFRAWMEQMLVDIVNTVRESLISEDMVRASWDVNGFSVVVGRSTHNVHISNGGDIISVDIRTTSSVVLSYREIISYKLNKPFSLKDAKPFADPSEWWTDNYLLVSVDILNFSKMLKKL